jgi:DNA-binding response OmpR family regulator
MPGSNRAEPTGVRILLVEDEAAIRRATTAALEGLGHTVDAVAELDAARALLGEQRYDLALLDLGLRQSSGGFVLIRHIRAAGLPTAIVVLSGTQDHEDMLAAIRLGVADFVPKPVRTSELICVVRRVLALGTVAANGEEGAVGDPDSGGSGTTPDADPKPGEEGAA